MLIIETAKIIRVFSKSAKIKGNKGSDILELNKALYKLQEIRDNGTSTWKCHWKMSYVLIFLVTFLQYIDLLNETI